MPAADATVDVTILGQELKFTGNGYHDKVCSAEALAWYSQFYVVLTCGITELG